jgi:bifunctional non-homologous end joining protein LigD
VITHPEKVLFPDDGITKGDLAAYYEAMARVILPHLRGRPVTMERYPAGIGEKGFWQKDVSKGFPPWLQRVRVPKKDGVVHHPVVTDTRSLLWITNQNTITQHVWTSRVPHLDRPDLCVFDLDPSRDNVAEVRAAAIGLRDLLDELGLPSWVKTTGSKGFHIVVPVDGKTDIAVVAPFANAVGALFVSLAPDRLTQEFSKVDRRGRIYVDTGRNGYSATFAAAYTVRARRGAPVSAPCTWEEIERGEVHPGTFTVRNMPERIAKIGDVWADMRRRARSLKRPLEKLRQLGQR